MGCVKSLKYFFWAQASYGKTVKRKHHGKHRSLDKSSKHTVERLLRLPFVDKVVLGISNACRHRYAPGAVRFQGRENVGVRVTLFSGKGSTVAYIYSHESERLIQHLKEF